MSNIKEKKESEISTKYTMKLFYEESMISGFLHMRIRRIRNIMRAWKAENAKQDKDNSEE